MGKWNENLYYEALKWTGKKNEENNDRKQSNLHGEVLEVLQVCHWYPVVASQRHFSWLKDNGQLE